MPSRYSADSSRLPRTSYQRRNASEKRYRELPDAISHVRDLRTRRDRSCGGFPALAFLLIRRKVERRLSTNSLTAGACVLRLPLT
jgi:hypothetical protein